MRLRGAVFLGGDVGYEFRTVWNEMASFSTDGTHMNVLTEDAGSERIWGRSAKDLIGQYTSEKNSPGGGSILESNFT